MDDLNTMLSSILENPEAMNQLRAAAAALGLDPDGPPPWEGGGDPDGREDAAAPQPAREAAPRGSPEPGGAAAQNAPMPDLSALAALFGVQPPQPQPPPTPSIDPATLRLIQGAVAKMNQPDKNVDLLRALKPHFSAARSARVDDAIRLLRLFAMLPVLKESGILGRFGELGGNGGMLGNLLGGGRRP